MHPVQKQNENANVILHILFSIAQFFIKSLKPQKCMFYNEKRGQDLQVNRWFFEIMM
jgi:hypothetical protein